MAKDAKGHGSEPRHMAGVNTIGRRFQAIVQPYSLAAGRVGEHIGGEHVISSHDSIGEAGKRLGSVISGKMQGYAGRIAGLGNGYKLMVKDTHTGQYHPRNDARKLHERNRATKA